MPRNKSPLPGRSPAPQRAAKRVIVPSRSASSSAARSPAEGGWVGCRDPSAADGSRRCR